MSKLIIHLSDIHCRCNWEESVDNVLSTFFQDLEKQIKDVDRKNVYLFLSGDIVQSADSDKLYNKFSSTFLPKLSKIGIKQDNIVCVPGNHDVSQNIVARDYVEHNEIINQALDEKSFNDYISKPNNILCQKFDAYTTFKDKFSNGIINKYDISGGGFMMTNDIGVYCLNTALCSFGGYNSIEDKGKLQIDTRSIHKWLLSTECKVRILVMHHPVSFLAEWCQDELNSIINKHFTLVLSGHSHKQNLFHNINNDKTIINCYAPPLFSFKQDNLGYAIVRISEEGIHNIKYRQWTNSHNSFVSGVNFSGNDSGEIVIKEYKTDKRKQNREKINEGLYKRLDQALQMYSAQPIVWADRLLSKTNLLTDIGDNTIVKISDFINDSKSTIIKAPPQFGLTCLSLHLAAKAWNEQAKIWIYLDFKKLTLHNIKTEVDSELLLYSATGTEVDCIIIDSWCSTEKYSHKIIEKICDLYKDARIVISQTIDYSKFFNDSETETINREFNVLHLLELERSDIRKVISEYNDKRHIAPDETTVLSKVISDLEVLNIHRTPLNCLTLLKVSEKMFDESPVNRTKMLEMVLIVLFDMGEVPKYKKKPDMKDCEYILGRFCEQMIRTDSYVFTRDHFIQTLKGFCKERLMDLEVDVVFDILYSNRIIITNYNGLFCFKFSYWIYYFAAQRMYADESFAEYMLTDRQYVSFPEIIEFYTGIDRRREDALRILLSDLTKVCNDVNTKVGLPNDWNPYKAISWAPTPESIEKLHSEIGDDIHKSNLPDAVKDQYADRFYDKNRPYDQTIHKVMSDYSVFVLMQNLKATSRALRNSDYVCPQLKKQTLSEITRSWEQISKVILALSPLLAKDGYATFDGAGFILGGDFGKTIEDRFNSVVRAIPYNVVNLFRNDLFSHKMSTLLSSSLENENNEIIRHELALFIVYNRPNNWKEMIQNYIANISKNSYYLGDIINILRSEYKFSFASEEEIRDLGYLIKMAIAKHKTGSRVPGRDSVSKISDKVLPSREVL